MIDALLGFGLWAVEHVDGPEVYMLGFGAGLILLGIGLVRLGRPRP